MLVILVPTLKTQVSGLYQAIPPEFPAYLTGIYRLENLPSDPLWGKADTFPQRDGLVWIEVLRTTTCPWAVSFR